MNPGPELDMLIAEKVMGWKKFIIKDNEYLLPNENAYLDIINAWNESFGYFLVNIMVPPYSLDIKSSFEVVDKLKEMGFWFEIILYDRYDVYSGPWCKVTINGTPAIYTDASITLPYSICMVALKAVGEYNNNVTGF